MPMRVRRARRKEDVMPLLPICFFRYEERAFKKSLVILFSSVSKWQAFEA
jgi:hypothetical protein